MKKLIKFDLPMNGKKIKDMEELTDNMTVEILGHYKSGLLGKWLKVRQHESELSKLEQFAGLEDPALLKSVCEMFGIAITDEVVEAILLPAPTFFGEKIVNLESSELDVPEVPDNIEIATILKILRSVVVKQLLEYEVLEDEDITFPLNKMHECRLLSSLNHSQAAYLEGYMRAIDDFLDDEDLDAADSWGIHYNFGAFALAIGAQARKNKTRKDRDDDDD